MKIKVTKNSINNTHRNYNGGYIHYFKLVKKFFEPDFKLFFNELSFFHKVGAIISLSAQFLFKPLLSMVHTKTIYRGDYVHENGILTKSNLKKIKIYFFLRILPFYGYVTKKIKQSDWEIIN